MSPAPGRTRTLRRLPTQTARPRLTVTSLDPETELPVTRTLDQAAEVAFESCPPIRRIPHYIGQKHTPGWFWSATTGTLLGYESYLESQWLTLYDFDPVITGISTQSLILDGVGVGEVWEHTPDIFCRRSDGTALLVDVKNPRLLDHPDVLLQAERTLAACEELGWDYRLVGAVEAQRFANISWLAGYRRPPHSGAELADRLIALARRPVAIDLLLSFMDEPELAFPVLCHLLWHHRLICDLDAPLRASTTVTAAKDPS
ncbi:TnsA-like heteromeric transposase endonuclease subunit [Streptomyces marianii]|uniref:TnsA-like heteromeric transposase endonuclease subunit n=1 Tax=Streptomyces marianii TaxID=1817406 RepID=UPI001F17DDE1|nr:TnsA-like heteromeric transposase endonuclease subunit [Streptomyces marianii]